MGIKVFDGGPNLDVVWFDLFHSTQKWFCLFWSNQAIQKMMKNCIQNLINDSFWKNL